MSISFQDYDQWLGGHKTNGRARKAIADQIMDATFTQDIQHQIGYFFDYYHTIPENRLLLEGFNPDDDPYPVPIELKFIAHAKNTMDKDSVTMHIQFRPHQQCVVSYYDKVFGKRYNARWPVGLYCWLMGDDGIYRRWLVVGTADRDENQFPTWEVLRCTDVYRWIKDGKYYEFPGVSRSQNSYNSGLWTDYKTTQVEDQTKLALPLNRDTEHLFYNTSLVIDAAVLTEPRCWLVSKVNRDNVKGIVVVTCKQDTANQHTFKADYDEDGNVIAWWADWEASAIAPTKGVSDEIPDQEDDDFSPAPSLISTVTCSGKRQIKIGGSQKTLTVRFTDGYGDPIGYQPGEWSFVIDDEPVSEDLLTVTPVNDQGKIKLKFHGGDDFIGKVLTATFTSGDVISSLAIEIIAL